MSEEADFAALEAELGAIMAAVSPDRRAGLAVRMGRALRQAQARRIAQQKNPDGSPFAPRKPREGGRARRGAIRRRAKGGPMFRKLRLVQWLRNEAGTDELVVGFAGAAGRIARVHQLGLRDRVSGEPGAPEVTYAARVLIGFRHEDIEMLLGMAAEEIARR